MWFEHLLWVSCLKTFPYWIKILVLRPRFLDKPRTFWKFRRNFSKRCGASFKTQDARCKIKNHKWFFQSKNEILYRMSNLIFNDFLMPYPGSLGKLVPHGESQHEVPCILAFAGLRAGMRGTRCRARWQNVEGSLENVGRRGHATAAKIVANELRLEKTRSVY